MDYLTEAIGHADRVQRGWTDTFGFGCRRSAWGRSQGLQALGEKSRWPSKNLGMRQTTFDARSASPNTQLATSQQASVAKCERLTSELTPKTETATNSVKFIPLARLDSDLTRDILFANRDIGDKFTKLEQIYLN